MKSIKFLLCLLLSSTSYAATQYVSDDLAIFMHSGPSLEYRIIGSIQVGTAVSTLKYNKETKFMQVKSPKGRVGWVKSTEIQEKPPAKSLLPQIQQTLLDSQNKLKTIDDDNKQAMSASTQAIIDKDNLIQLLEDDKRILRDNITDLKSHNLDLELLNITAESRVGMNRLMEGGSLLFIGLVIGLVMPFLPRRKRKNEGW